MQFALNFRQSIGFLSLSLSILLLPMACSEDKQGTTTTTEAAVESTFTLHTAERTGLDFVNTMTQSDTFNVMTYMYFYNGGGVAVGDFNLDGLQDVYFTGNMTQNGLFLNRGGLKFEDVTEKSGTGGDTRSWTSGVTAVDINADGMLDLYVSQMAAMEATVGHNFLFVCEKIENGIPIFSEKSKEYGLDLMVMGTQSAFFDYDRDGDLDVYILNHSIHGNGTFGPRKDFMYKPHPWSGDRFLRNDGPPRWSTDGKRRISGGFTDVTAKTGIFSNVIGYGLGVVVGDVNRDGWPDLYVGNDFHENDYLYLNQKNGTFKEVLTEQMPHTSRFTMGVDFADFNNDGHTDIVSLDMLPDDPFILKTSLAEDGYDTYRFKLGYGYNDQFSRNNLQLNNGNGTFSDIGLYSGTFATDWSWAVLASDYDHDGHTDMFIANGIERRMNDVDYINYRDEDAQKAAYGQSQHDPYSKIVESMPQIKLPNVFFKNSGTLQFDKNPARISGNLPSYSNGAAHADFDNDGDLDIVTNNLFEKAFIYENTTISANHTSKNGSFLHLSLKGEAKNPYAVGATVQVFKRDGQRLTSENFPVRGFQSSVQHGIFMGLGDTSTIDSVVLIWPDWSRERLDGRGYGRRDSLFWRPNLPKANPGRDFQIAVPKPTAALREVNPASVGISYQHQENSFVDFNREALIPRMVSTEGPALAVADVNGDGLEDVFFGSARGFASVLYLQTAKGTFIEKKQASFQSDIEFEDVDAAFADLDGDGDLDLVVASGGNEFFGNHPYQAQRFYLNDGSGLFSEKVILPNIFMTASCVAVGDCNADGKPDLFFGGRAIPWEYGLIPDSYLLLNEGNGRFTQAPPALGAALSKVGFVKNAQWQDMDADGKTDLVLALEWDAVTIAYNTGNGFDLRPVGAEHGWWNSAFPCDLDGDGDLDLLCGNVGENSKLKPTPKEPIRMYVNDFDDDGKSEQLLTYYHHGKEIHFATHAELMKRLVKLKKKYRLSKDLARASKEDLFGAAKLSSAKLYSADCFRNVWYQNMGNRTYKIHDLPPAVQLSSLAAFAAFSRLGAEDPRQVYAGGNFFENNIEMGKYDADFGHLLRFDLSQKPIVAALPLAKPIWGQVRRAKTIKIGGKEAIIAVRNDASPILLLQ